MDNHWDNYIEANICQPLEIALQGRNPGIAISYGRFDLGGKIWFVKDKNNKGALLYQHLLPYLEEYLFYPQRRMSDGFEQNENEALHWQQAATLFIASYLRECALILPIFEGRDLYEIIDGWVDQYAAGFNRTYLHFTLLVSAMKNGYKTDWEKLSFRVKAELMHCPSDYDKGRLDYYCFLDGIIKIANYQDADAEQKCELWTLLEQKWSILAAIYSVMTGKIIHTGYNHFSQIISHFRSAEKEYALLMVAAIRHHPQVLQTNKSKQIYQELEKAARQIKQKQDLNKLCGCLFPSEKWDDYNLSVPKMTAAEMAAKINFLENELANSNTRKEDQSKLEAYAEYLKQQLGKSISMEDLSAAILNCPAQFANLIFTQLDLRLEDVNPVWTSHRKELKYKVLAKEVEEKNLLNDTCSKVTAIEKSPHSVHIEHNTAPINIGQQNNYEGITPREVQNQLNNTETSCHLLESTTERLTSISR